LADTHGSGPCALAGVEVRVLSGAPASARSAAKSGACHAGVFHAYRVKAQAGSMSDALRDYGLACPFIPQQKRPTLFSQIIDISAIA